MFSFNPLQILSSNRASAIHEDKNLRALLNSERKLAMSWTQISEEHRAAANQLKKFGQPLGEDLTDVTSKLGDLLLDWASILLEFAQTYEQYQTTLKSIADKEATLFASREKRRRLKEAIENHQENHPGAVDKLMELKEQLAALEDTSLPQEVEMGNFKRIALREAMYILLNGMHEMASKTDIISTFAKYIVDELNVTPIKPGEERSMYHATEHTARIVKDARRTIEHWKPDDSKLRRTLTAHHGRNPLIQSHEEKQLPPPPPPPTSEPAMAQDDRSHPSETEDSDKVDDNPSGEDTLEPKGDKDETSPADTTEANVEESALPDDALSLHKPDEPSTDHNRTCSTTPDNSKHLEAQPEHVPVDRPPASPNIGPGGFSSFYLDNQNLYQFYQHYAPPRPYEEMARQQFNYYHLSPHNTPYLGPIAGPGRGNPGGFVLPTANPNFVHPQPSVSASTASSIPSAGIAPEPTASTSLTARLSMTSEHNKHGQVDNEHGHGRSARSPVSLSPSPSPSVSGTVS